MELFAELGQRKTAIRREAQANREAQPNKDVLSRAICRRFAEQPEYASAGTVMLYVHMRSEVRTQPFLPEAIGQGKRVVVPYCVDNALELFRLETLDELVIGTYGILEPRLDLRALPDKRVPVSAIDLVMVPGVAFDRRGGRLGHGKGYYDKLLVRMRPETLLVGMAYECQVFPEVPMLEHDVYLDRVITEQAVYPGRGRGGP